MELNILLGFDNESVKKIIQENLEKNGYDVTIACRTTKKAVKEYVQKNPDCNVVVLQEAIGLDKYKYADEVTALTDNRDVNVVFVISERHKGTDYVARLYSAGITGVLFQVSRSGVSVKDICKQIVKPRSRKEAREYYGISENEALENYSSPEVDKSMELYEMFINGEGNVLENFFNVCNVAELDMPQIAGFIKRLPSETKTDLAQYEEFHQVLSFLRAGGIDVGIKKPKRLSVGLKSDTKYEVGASGVRLVNDKADEPEEKEEEVDLSNLSMEELFARAMSGDTGVETDESADEEPSETVEDSQEENDVENEPEEELSQKDLDKLEYARKKQEARELEAERKAAQLKEREEKRRQAEEEREEKRRIAEEEKEEKRKLAAIEKEKNLAKKQEEDAIRAKEREEEKAKRKEVFDEKKAQFLGNMKAIGNKMKEDQAERAKQRELLAKEKEKQAEEKEFVWDEEDDDVLLDAGGTSVGFGIGMIVFIVILVALIGFVGWLSMGNHISIGGFKI